MSTQTQLKRVFAELVRAVQADAESLLSLQKYLDLALEAESRADLCLLWAEYESELIYECLRVEEARENARKGSPQPRLLAELSARFDHLDSLLTKVSAAAVLFQLADEHNIRGQLYFLKNFKIK